MKELFLWFASLCEKPYEDDDPESNPFFDPEGILGALIAAVFLGSLGTLIFIAATQ